MMAFSGVTSQYRPDKADCERVKDIRIHVPCKCRRRPERHAGCFTSSASAEIRWQPPQMELASMRIMSADIPTSSRAISPSNSAVATAAVKPRIISTVRCMRRQ